MTSLNFRASATSGFAQDVIAHDAAALADSQLRAHAREIGVLESGHVFVDEFQRHHHLLPALDFAVRQIADIGRIDVADLGRMLEVRLEMAFVPGHDKKADAAVRHAIRPPPGLCPAESNTP